jgi:hypothetical protein
MHASVVPDGCEEVQHRQRATAGLPPVAEAAPAEADGTHDCFEPLKQPPSGLLPDARRDAAGAGRRVARHAMSHSIGDSSSMVSFVFSNPRTTD